VNIGNYKGSLVELCFPGSNQLKVKLVIFKKAAVSVIAFLRSAKTCGQSHGAVMDLVQF
jgi:hypothetical protein